MPEEAVVIEGTRPMTSGDMSQPLREGPNPQDPLTPPVVATGLSEASIVEPSVGMNGLTPSIDKSPMAENVRSDSSVSSDVAGSQIAVAEAPVIETQGLTSAVPDAISQVMPRSAGAIAPQPQQPETVAHGIKDKLMFWKKSSKIENATVDSATVPHETQVPPTTPGQGSTT